MPQFDETTFVTQIFWLIICFSILCIMMKVFVVPRLVSSLEAREHRCQEDWAQAQELNSSQEKMREEALARLAEARGNAHAKMHEVLHEIHHSKADKIAYVEEELAKKTKKIRQDIDKKTEKILSHMEPVVSQVVKATSRRVLGQPLTQAEIKKALSDVLQQSEKT